MKNIYLVGMRGSGKSTVGKLLAHHLKRPFVDLDNQVREAAGMAIHAIVSDQGWDSFRQLERQAVQKVIQTSGNVVATGGGVLMFFDNAEGLKKSGRVIFLRVDPSVLCQRIAKDTDRPSLTGTSAGEEVERVWEERKATYEQYADITIEADRLSPQEVVDRIVQELSPTS